LKQELAPCDGGWTEQREIDNSLSVLIMLVTYASRR